MSKDNFTHHQLRDFFEARPNDQGYQLKYIQTGMAGGGRSKMLDIDHVVPKRWGGVDHPRNYVAMHCSMNRSFGSALPEEKWAYLGKSVTRGVAVFVKGIYDSQVMQDAIEKYILNAMPSK
eukprot:scaffold121499_cov63-Phaeocystis_antarctica.AAC.1